MHTRRRGKSGSAKPSRATLPEWIDYSPEELEETIEKLSEEGHTPSEIGTILRDQYGVPTAKLAIGKKITQVLQEKKQSNKLPEDLRNLLARAVNLQRHLQENPKDSHSKRGLEQVESKIRRLVKYYKRRGRLPKDWEYKSERAELLLE